MAGWCSTPTQLLICSPFSRENGHLLLICSSISTSQMVIYHGRIPKKVTQQKANLHLVLPWASWVVGKNRSNVSGDDTSDGWRPGTFRKKTQGSDDMKHQKSGAVVFMNDVLVGGFNPFEK